MDDVQTDNGEAESGLQNHICGLGIRVIFLCSGLQSRLIKRGSTLSTNRKALGEP